MSDPGAEQDQRAARMSYTHPMGFDACQDEVEGMMRAGEPFCDVEATIENARITEDEGAALWLFAWSIRDRLRHMQDFRAMPAGLSVIGG